MPTFIRNAVISYDALTGINWVCQKCGIKFGATPDKNGIVSCEQCGNTNTDYSQHLTRSLSISSNQESSNQESLNQESLNQEQNTKTTKKVSMLQKKRIVSGIRPTGDLHLGNYFGAIKQFLDLQQQASECFFFVADLHALTTAVEDKIDLDVASLEVVRLYLACGVDPGKVLLYRQSDIAEISYLHVLLSMVAPVGELERCVTYKEKTQDLESKKKLVSLGLLAYPGLMAADILIVNADIVPVGKDQEQHLEITREIARRYNYHFGKQMQFVEPKNYNLQPIKVPGLQASKMSKSVGEADNVIYLLDKPSLVEKKVKAAKTDLGPEPNKPMSEEMQNIFQLLSLCSPKEQYDFYYQKYQACEQKFYGALKKQLAKDINELLAPIQDRYYNDPNCSSEFVTQLLFEHATRVRPLAKRTLRAVQEDMSFKKLALHL